MSNREKLITLMDNLALTPEQAARLMAEKTGDRISARSVYRWIAGEGTSQSRRCPGWVPIILESAAQEAVLPVDH